MVIASFLVLPVSSIDFFNFSTSDSAAINLAAVSAASFNDAVAESLADVRAVNSAAKSEASCTLSSATSIVLLPILIRAIFFPVVIAGIIAGRITAGGSSEPVSKSLRIWFSISSELSRLHALCQSSLIWDGSNQKSE